MELRIELLWNYLDGIVFIFWSSIYPILEMSNTSSLRENFSMYWGIPFVVLALSFFLCILYKKKSLTEGNVNRKILTYIVIGGLSIVMVMLQIYTLFLLKLFSDFLSKDQFYYYLVFCLFFIFNCLGIYYKYNTIFNLKDKLSK